jgi:hypothetical protein
MRRALVAFALVVVGLPVLAAGAGAGPEPTPIPGGLKPPGSPVLHVWAPGPVGLNDFAQGVDVEPSTITNFRGMSAIAYVQGKARTNSRSNLDLDSDMRLFVGTYMKDGVEHRGAFAFI